MDFKVNPFPQEYAHTCPHMCTHMCSHTTPPACMCAPYAHVPHVYTFTRMPHPHMLAHAHTSTHVLTPHTPVHTHHTAVHVHTHTAPAHPSSPNQPPLCTSSFSFLGPSPARSHRSASVARSARPYRAMPAPPLLPGFSCHTESDCETHPGTAHPLVCSFSLLRGIRCVDTPRAASPFGCWGHWGCFQSSAVLHTLL